MGYTVCDQLLNATGERLKQAIDPGTVAARLNGEEFAILIEPRALKLRFQLIEHLTRKIQKLFTIHGTQIHTSPHTVPARYPSDGASASGLPPHDDQSLTKATDERSSPVFYDSEQQKASSERAI